MFNNVQFCYSIHCHDKRGIFLVQNAECAMLVYEIFADV